jgi:hypothetical protein
LTLYQTVFGEYGSAFLCNRPVMAEIVCQEHGGHTAAAQLALEPVSVR